MAGITTHVLDTDRGQTIPGIRIDFSVRDGDTWRLVKTVTTNADGRTDQPILPAAEAKVGTYQLEFHVADYLAQRAPGAARFVDNAVVRFAIFDEKQHYHVPLLCTPNSCTTYRGS